jgi:hypothetical protein
MNRMRTAVAALTVALVTSFGAGPAHAADQDEKVSVRPVLECVSTNGDGSLVAVFGSFNDGAADAAVPVGPHNHFTESEWDRGQPTQFAPGRTVASFSVTFTGQLHWVLDGTPVTASATSPPCNSAPNVSEATMPLLLALVLMVLAGGWMRWQRRQVA